MSSADVLVERTKTITETKATKDDPNKVSHAERAKERAEMSYNSWSQLVQYVSLPEKYQHELPEAQDILGTIDGLTRASNWSLVNMETHPKLYSNVRI